MSNLRTNLHTNLRTKSRGTESCAGRALAASLAGCWRTNPDPTWPTHSGEARQLQRILERSGAGELAPHWQPGERSTPNTIRPPRPETRLAHRVHQHNLQLAAQLLHKHQLPFLTAKGLAAAQYYARPERRSFGDIDLFVPPHRYNAAKRVLNRALPAGTIDLHPGISDLAPLDFRVIYSSRVALPGFAGLVCTPSPELHLRLMCRHAARHGIWRPTWLTDIAACAEAHDGRLNWTQVLAGSPVDRDWILALLGTAHRLWELKSSALPPGLAGEHRARSAAWVEHHLLHLWGAGHHPAPSRLEDDLRRRRGPLELVQARWPNPLRALWLVQQSEPQRGLSEFQARRAQLIVLAQQLSRGVARVRRMARGKGRRLPPHP